MQQTDFAFKALQYPSAEEGSMMTTKQGMEMGSQVEGEYNGQPFSIYYELVTDAAWNTTELNIDVILGKQTSSMQYHKDKKGNWYQNNILQPQFAGCTDVDITATPFTNTLPFKRLQTAIGTRAAIKVLYFDIFEQTVCAKEQFYTKLSDTEYKFEQPADNFTAIIEVDADGMVTNYPGMFERIVD